MCKRRPQVAQVGFHPGAKLSGIHRATGLSGTEKVAGQGLLLIEFAQHGEEALKIPATGTEGGGHVFVAVESQERQQRVPQGSQILRGVACRDLAGILFQGHVANVM